MNKEQFIEEARKRGWRRKGKRGRISFHRITNFNNEWIESNPYTDYIVRFHNGGFDWGFLLEHINMESIDFILR